MRPPADRCFFSVIRLASGGYETSGYLAASLII